MNPPTNKVAQRLVERLKAAGIDPKADRWSNGTEHHPDAYTLVQELAEIDYMYFGDSLCLKIGGDGDNGETLCYMLDVLFELHDHEKPT